MADNPPSELRARLAWLTRSSTLRLTVMLSVLFALGMTAAVFAALSLGRDAVLRRVDASLEGLASAITVADAETARSDVIVRPLDDLGRLPRPFRRAAERGGGTVTLEQEYREADVWRALVARDVDGVGILIAMPLEDSEDALEALAETLWATVALVVVLTLGVGLVAGLIAQRRVVQINATLGRLAAGDLTARTGTERARDDLGDIALRLDQAAGELERLVAQTRHLSVSLAHDLRTPLARLRARLEALPQGEERGAALEEAGRLSEIFDTIMRVARIEAAQGEDGFEPVALTELLAEVEEVFGPVVEDAGKVLHVTIETDAVIRADRQMLIQALANLIQNAIVHGGSEIALFAAGRSMGVADNGPGVDPEAYGEILKPMVRLDAARGSEGTGLGLALVRAVADRHGAKLVLDANQPQGLRVSLNFADL